MARILIIEADRQLAKYAASFLGVQGHDVVCCANPQTAISVTDASQPDLIVLNLSLAFRSGVEFLYELRSYPEWQGIPVIVTSRLDPAEQSAYSQAFSQLNVSNYVPKENLSLSELSYVAGQLLQPASR